jgi:hypothetical protein
MPEHADSPVDHQAQVEIARWTHAWMCAAAMTHEQLESTWDDESPASSIGARDALSLVVIDAVRNTYRGAAAALGPDSDPVRTFEERQPDLKVVRDRFEHFEDYLRGTGRAQKSGKELLALDDLFGLEIRSSSGGGPGGHSIKVAVRERDGEKTYVIQTGAAVDAARVLAPAVLAQVGLYDEQHAERCVFCKRLGSSLGA